MHEFSLARSLCLQVLEILRRDGSGGVASASTTQPPGTAQPPASPAPAPAPEPNGSVPNGSVPNGSVPNGSVPNVCEIKVRCGPLSGVEPLLLREAFETLRQDSPLADAELVIVEERLWARCLDCGEPFEPERFRLVCPHCGSGRTQIASGDAVILESLLVDSHERPA